MDLQKLNKISGNDTRMDLQKLNEISGNDKLPVMKLYDLDIDRNYFVTALKPEMTKTGPAIFAELDCEFLVRLPDRVSDALYKEDAFLNHMMDAANKYALSITYLGNSNMKFYI